MRRNIGVVFQNPDIQIIGATVEEDVAFGPENLSLSPSTIRERVHDSLAKKIAHLLNRETHALSGGEKRLVTLAGVLAMEPEIIVLDEPTAYLDARAAQAVRAAIRNLNDGGITIVHITHYVEDAIRADNIAIMHKGKILVKGKSADVLCSDEILSEAGLQSPPIRELVLRLRRQGFDMSTTVFSVDAAHDEIARLLEKVMN